MEALDLQIDIGLGADGYHVTARGPGGAEATAPMRLPLGSGELDLLLDRVKSTVSASSARLRRIISTKEQPVYELGGLLFKALLADGVGGLLMAIRQQATREARQLRLVLRAQPPELARLPWEFLFDAEADDYLCLSTPLIRYPTVPAPHRPLRVDSPLRILGMVARPGDQQSLAVDEERQRLHAALADLEREGRVELHWVAGQNWRELQEALRRGPWHVFHFIGHGRFDEMADEGALALVENGRTRPLHACDLAMVLCRHPSLRLVLLNACESGQASAADPFSSVAGKLVQKGLPAVLAMQFEITDQAAVEFSRTFYAAVADQLPVDMGVIEARQAIRLALPGTMEWGTPVLYLRSADGHLFDVGHPAARHGDVPVGPAVRQRDIALEEIEALYTGGLDAFYTERWDEAVEIFRCVAAWDSTFKDTAVRLEQALRKQQLAADYAGADAAARAGAWEEAIERIKAVLAAEPDHRDGQALLRHARGEHVMMCLEAAVRALHRARQWEAVVSLGARLAALDPRRGDPGGLVSSAQAQLLMDQRPRLLQSLYQQALQYIEADAWGQAFHTLSALRRMDPWFPNTAKLIDRVRRELARIEARDWSPSELREIPVRKSVNAVAFSPDGARLALGCAGRTAWVMDVASGEERLSLRHGTVLQEVTSVAFSPDGGRLATASYDHTARIWGAGSGTELVRVTHVQPVTGVAFSPDGGRLATASHDHTARIWDAGTGTELLEVAHGNMLTGVAFSPDGGRLATVSHDHTARIWDAGTGTELLEVAHGNMVTGVAFSPDGRRLATASWDHTARIWDTDSGAELLRVTHTNWVQGVAFSPLGQRFATASWDKTARIWDVGTGTELLQVAHAHRVTGVAFSPDGRRLATASLNKTSKVWQLVPAEPEPG